MEVNEKGLVELREGHDHADRKESERTVQSMLPSARLQPGKHEEAPTSTEPLGGIVILRLLSLL